MFLTRRRFLTLASAGALVAKGVQAGTKLSIPVTIDLGDGRPMLYRARLSPGATIYDAVTQIAKRYQLNFAAGTNPVWSDPDGVTGQQLLQLLERRNSDMPAIEGLPGWSLPAHWWTIFLGPSKKLVLDRDRGRLITVTPAQLKSQSYLLLGPTASLTTTPLGYFEWPLGRRIIRVIPQLYLWYGFPNGPYD
jgi:hypothetical protein